MNQSNLSTQRVVSRRAVVRAGAHAAWAVPAISIATAAPALAVSGGAALQGSAFRVKFNAAQKKLSVFVGALRNTGGTATGGPVTVVVSAPASAQTSMSRPYDAGVQNSWTYAGRSSSATTDDYTFVSRTGSLKPNQSTGALSFQLATASSTKPAGQFTYIATTPGGTGTAGSTTATTAASAS
jgi:hypothetical protein